MTTQETIEDTTPRVYVASLSDYNNGSLLGRWFELTDFTDADELLHAIQGMLTIYDDKYGVLMGSPREEWAVHDFEYIPKQLYSESMDFAAVYEWLDAVADMDEERAEAYELFIDNGDEASEFNDRYRGYYGGDSAYDNEKTAATYAEEQLYECISVDEIPASVRNYIDFVSMGRDYVLGGDIWIANGHVFLS